MELERAYHIDDLTLSLYADEKHGKSIHLVCNNYRSLDDQARKLLHIVSTYIGHAIELCTSKEYAESYYSERKTQRFDITTKGQVVPARDLYRIACHALDILTPYVERTKYPASKAKQLCETLVDAPHHERTLLATQVRGRANELFSSFKQAADIAQKNDPDSPQTKMKMVIAKKLTHHTAERLVYRVILDHFLGDKALAALSKDTGHRGLEETIDQFVARTHISKANAIQQKMDEFMQDEQIGGKLPAVRKYLAGELAEAVANAIAFIDSDAGKRVANRHPG